MTCPKCGSHNVDGSKFCQACGATFNDWSICPLCKKIYDKESDFCPSDGSRLLSREYSVYKCTKCGREYSQDVKKCPLDGADVMSEYEILLSQKPKWSFDGTNVNDHNKNEKRHRLDPEDVVRNGFELKIGQWISRAWDLIFADIWLYIAVICLSALLSYILNLGDNIVTDIATFTLNIAFSSGMYYVALRRIKGESPSISDVVEPLRTKFLQLAIASILTGLLSSLGYTLWYITGFFPFVLISIYLGVSYMFVITLIVDTDVDALTALKTSRRVTSKRWFGILGMLLIELVILVAGALCFGIGLFVAYPLVIMTNAIAYADIFKRELFNFI